MTDIPSSGGGVMAIGIEVWLESRAVATRTTPLDTLTDGDVVRVGNYTEQFDGIVGVVEVVAGTVHITVLQDGGDIYPTEIGGRFTFPPAALFLIKKAVACSGGSPCPAAGSAAGQRARPPGLLAGARDGGRPRRAGAGSRGCRAAPVPGGGVMKGCPYSGCGFTGTQAEVDDHRADNHRDEAQAGSDLDGGTG